MLRATTGPTRPTSAQTSRSHDKTTHYHAYLPPILDLASPFSEPHVTLHTIPIPHQQHSSESIVPLEPPRHVSESLAQSSSCAEITFEDPDKRPVDDVDPHAESSSGRRRSKRLRPSDSFLAALPHLDQTESLISSLNTTASLPPSAPNASVAHLPRWTLPLGKLTTLQAVLAEQPPVRTRSVKRPAEDAGPQRVTVMCCVMSVEPPVQRQRRGGGRAGRDAELWIASWRVSAPPPRGESMKDPVSCDVKLWEGCARDWGSMVRKGDVVLIQEATFRPASPAAGEGAQLVLSPTGGQLPPAPVVLFRTLPRYSAIMGDYVYRPGARGAVPAGDRGDMMDEDVRLRPDLRLARSDPGMRKVADMARWCAEWVGGEAPL